jgi:putative component of toxin-antitoxin plasmid stabilization module
MQPRFRIIREVLDANGKGIVSKWVADELTITDKARIESRFNQIELSETRNPKWLDRYVSLKMWEIRVDTGGKALRFLCEEDGSDVILVVGCIKRGSIKSTQETQAKARRDLYREGKMNVRNYPLPQRPLVDVEEPDG